MRRCFLGGAPSRREAGFEELVMRFEGLESLQPITQGVALGYQISRLWRYCAEAEIKVRDRLQGNGEEAGAVAELRRQGEHRFCA
jgi:hypothetical protein